jgi:hypothetical protein
MNNSNGCWEIIEREDNWGIGIHDIDVYADEIGGEVGQVCLVQLRDEEDNILDSHEIKAK